MAKQVTMKDIALELGVSTVSVSKALGDREGVSDEVRARIKRKAAEMGYKYNPSSQDPIGANPRIQGVIGVVVAERHFKDSSFYNDLYARLVVELSKHGFTTMLEVIASREEKSDILPSCVATSSVRGLVVIGKLRRQYIERIRATGIICMFMDFYDDSIDSDAVVSDGVYGAYMLTNHLIDMGHREIGYIGNIFATGSIMDRYLGFYKAMLEHDLPMKDEWLISDRGEDGKIYPTIKLPKKLPTALVCNCDEVACQLIRQLNENGIRVPDDISIVGFDDYIYAKLSNPQLTTFHINVDQMTQFVSGGIYEKMQNPGARLGRLMVSGDVVKRDSVKQLK